MEGTRRWSFLNHACCACTVQITFIIPDEIASQALASGLTPERYVEKWIAEQTASPQTTCPTSELSLEEFNASLDRLTRYSEKIPSLPIQSFSRENFYGGRG